MESGSKKGTDRGAEDVLENGWIEGARQLSEEGRLAWLLGQGLQEALASIAREGGSAEDGATVAAQLRTWVTTASRAVTSLSMDSRPPEVSATRSTRATTKSRTVKKSASVFSWSHACTQRLDDRSYPVVFVGTMQIRKAWASLALGVDLNGNKHVLGGRDDTDVASLISDLAVRGLASQEGLLAVTDGSRRLDEAIERTWKGRARVQHCLYRLQRDLRDHAPDTERAVIERAFEAARRLPADEAQMALEDLHEQLRVAHPGASARMERSLKPALTVARLGVSDRLREQLQIQGVLRSACEQALKRGNQSATGLEAITSGLGAWLERARRFYDREALPTLAERLRGINQEAER